MPSSTLSVEFSRITCRGATSRLMTIVQGAVRQLRFFLLTPRLEKFGVGKNFAQVGGAYPYSWTPARKAVVHWSPPPLQACYELDLYRRSSLYCWAGRIAQTTADHSSRTLGGEASRLFVNFFGPTREGRHRLAWPLQHYLSANLRPPRATVREPRPPQTRTCWRRASCPRGRRCRWRGPEGRRCAPSRAESFPPSSGSSSSISTTSVFVRESQTKPNKNHSRQGGRCTRANGAGEEGSCFRNSPKMTFCSVPGRMCPGVGYPPAGVPWRCERMGYRNISRPPTVACFSCWACDTPSGGRHRALAPAIAQGQKSPQLA